MDDSTSTVPQTDASLAVGTSELPRIDELVLDAGPLVTQQRLTGLARKYYIPPSVVAELRDQRARDHLDWLRSEAGGACDVEVREAGAEARLAVAAFARQTGDYAVLSQPDMSVLALTYALEVQRHGQWRIRDAVGGKTGQQKQSAENAALEKDKAPKPATPKHVEPVSAVAGKDADELPAKEEEKNAAASSSSTLDDKQTKPAAVDPTRDLTSHMAQATIASPQKPKMPGWEEGEETDSEDDEETGGEWITPDNISNHKSRALGLVTDADLSLLQGAAKTKSNGRMRATVTQASDDGWSTVVSKNTVQQPTNNATRRRAAAVAAAKKAAGPAPRLTVACMTGDYAVQNVMLQMGLSLVGLEGQRIRQVKSWVLRCHACFKLCKDSERKFCPHCGNPTLLRTSVTSTDPQAAKTGAVKGGSGGAVQVHLKKNFQYKNRGTKFPLPLPKAGKASGAPAAVPILREDQAEWQKALNRERVQRGKEERSLQKALARGTDTLSARYEDVDELSILLAGKTNAGHANGLPALGIGRRNPNEKRRKKV